MVTGKANNVAVHENSKVSVSKKMTATCSSNSGSARSALITVSVIFLAFVSLLVWAYISFPKLEE
ncbi:hypothetical protein RUM43_014269 [Polyplax serrata]|uniref:Uncharacterized protein n=1 Tax=Polyplax serrata TaxID=468196 RepID=A0AAN8S646_POLSC